MKRIIWSRFFRHFFHSRRATGTRAARKQSTRAMIRPRLENLEDRTLPAPVFTVNASGDAGVGAGNSGDIRYCINQANVSTNTNATIVFNTQAIGGQITLTHGELEISNSMTIAGPGTATLAISGDATGNAPGIGTIASRVFNITSPGAIVTISGLTITGGNGSPSESVTPGNQGGDIFNGGTLTLQNDVIQNGFVHGFVGGPAARGGGIFNAEGQSGAAGASLTLSNVFIENNEARGADGQDGAPFLGASGSPGGFGAGGGLFNDSNATVTIQNGTQIINNIALGGKGGNGFFGANGSNNTAGPGVPGETGGSGGGGGAGMGGGLFNNTGGALSITGTNTSSIIITDNQAQGGNGGNGDHGGNGGNGGKLGSGGPGGAGGNGGTGGSTLGGGLYNSGSILSLQFAQFAGNQALAGNGGAASFGGNGGNGGSKGAGGLGGPGGAGGGGGGSQGGALYSAGSAFTLQNVQFTTDTASTPVGNQAIGGNGNTGSNGGHGGNGGGTKIAPGLFPPGGAAGAGGIGGSGGSALGGAVFNGGTATSNIGFVNVTMTTTLARGGAGSGGGLGGVGGTGGVHSVGGGAGAGGGGGAGGAAKGGGVYNVGGSLSFLNFSSTISQANAGNGGNGNLAGNGGVGGKGGGGNASTSFASASGLSGAAGGGGGAGGIGGAAQGGGFYNGGGTLTISPVSQFTNDSVTSGSGGNGGDGGVGGVGGVAGKKFFLSGAGGIGGPGGAGGDAGYADGGGGTNTGGNATITGGIFTNDVVQAGNGGNGGTGGEGGEGGDANGGVLGLSGTGGEGGAGGAGGGGSTAQGGGLSVTGGTLTITTSTFGGSTALADKVLGGNGGMGGTGGVINISGAPGHGFVLFPPQTPNGGQGGQGGAGTAVSGGGLAVSKSPPPTNVQVLTSFPGIDTNNSFDSTPPDTQGAAGPKSFVETVNSALAIFNKTTGALVDSDSQEDFFFTRGGITPASTIFPFISDSFTVYIPQIQRFVVGVLDLDLFGSDDSQIDLAISKSSDPKSLTANDWTFSKIVTTEAGFSTDYPGNLGYNDGAVVMTLNMFNDTGGPNHVEVVSIDMNALANGQPLVANTNVFQSDINPGPGQPAFSLRPTAMQGSTNPNDPMWLVGEAGDNASINVMEMTNILSSNPTFTTFNLAVNPYFLAVPPLQPDGSAIVGPGFIDSRIMNADENSNGLLVAAQAVSNASGDRDMAQWYEIDVSGATPVLKQEGDVTGGPGVFDAYPGIAINDNNDIGMSFIQSGTSSGQFMSVYVSGRLSGDPANTMETPVLVQAGVGVANLPTAREGDMSGINVDSDGTFWIANEFANTETPFNWGTAIANFQLKFTPPPSRAVSITDSSYDNNVLVGGNGGQGGKGGVLPNVILPPGSFIPVGGNNGDGGVGGDADGGGISLSIDAAETASLLGVDVSANSATGGLGGLGQFQDRVSLGLSGKGGSNSSAGGKGGSVVGAGVSSVNFNLTVSSSSKSASKVKGNVGIAGVGGLGGSYSLQTPDTSFGGNGGDGGSAEGGGIAFTNELSGAQNSLTLSVIGATVTNNQMTAAAGGAGGAAGTWGHDHILGGAGGAGGQALGGGLYIFAGATAVNSATITSDTMDNNTLTAGAGAAAGAGSSATFGSAAGPFAAGGAGGNAEGGGFYNNSLNGSSPGTLNVGYSTMAGNQLTAGNGGFGATGTTANGGPGGNGGNGGNAEGGGFFDGKSATLIVINTTIGGLAPSSQSPTTNSNILTAGSGGSGNNAGTPAGLSQANGGNGGNAGSTEGAGVFVNSATAQFVNDTIINNQALTPGLIGAAGSGAGSGGSAGTPGAAGVSEGGGYFAVFGNGQVNMVGNTILDLNSSVTTGADAEGTFSTLGRNILGSLAGSTGFKTTSPGTDMLATAAQLNIGPLLNNGGPTPTDALLNNANGKSVAIDAGDNNSITALLFGNPAFDQRGIGFPRIDTISNRVDIGAYELDKPTLTTVVGSTNVEGSIGVVLTINGSGFQPGATVNFGGTILTPTAANINGNQIVVTDPNPLPLDDDGPIPVSVGNPDGSGIAGETLSSNTVNFTITEAPFNLINPATGTTTNGGTITNGVNDNINLTIQPAAPDALPDVGNFSATNLPSGLSINLNTGVISGTILPGAVNGSSPVTYAITVTAFDGGLSGLKSTISFNWTINPFTLGTVNPQNNNEGDTLSAANNNTIQVLTSTGSVTTNYTDLVAGVHTLPPGLIINQNTGIISGTINPFAVTNGAATQTFVVTITAGPSGSTGSTTFNWTVNDTTPPAITNPGPQSNNIGDTLATSGPKVVPPLQIHAIDADTYSATGLPTGLSINPNTGLITGTITGTTSNVFGVTVTATDDGHSSSVNFLWTVTIPFGLINPGTESNDESDAVSLQMAPVSGYTASNYEASGLPTGLSINANSGLISGTIDPRAAGTYSVTVQANDTQGQTASITFAWNVADTTPPVLINPGPQTSIAGQTISHFAIGGIDVDPGTWSATGLPKGLTIDANTGVISGTIAASAVGNFTVTVTAADDGNVSAPMSFLWSVAAAPPPAPASPPSATPPSTPGIPAGAQGLTTNLTIVSVQNTYPGLTQLETVTVDVTSSTGFAVNEGIVTFQVNGKTLTAPVIHGVATVTFSTSLVDLNELDEYFFAHPLTASYSDSKGIFAPSGSGEAVPAIYIDFILSLLASQLRGLDQFQTP
jgi:hypothetical protein